LASNVYQVSGFNWPGPTKAQRISILRSFEFHQAREIQPNSPALALPSVLVTTAANVALALPRRPVALALPFSPVALALPFQPVALALPFQPVALALPFSPVALALPRGPLPLTWRHKANWRKSRWCDHCRSPRTRIA
jgi:hypothetical protein